MIVIVGDSCSKGAWKRAWKNNYPSLSLIHGGLGQFLLESGSRVVNLSSGGIRNYESAARLDSFLYEPNGFRSQVEKIIVFQTEWQRDWEEYLYEYQKFNYNYEIIKQRALARFYHKLSDISQDVNLPIHVIGGAVDTIWLDKFEQEYPGVKIVCQSFTNLLINNIHRIDNPVLSCWMPKTRLLVESAKNYLTSEDLSKLLDDMDAAENRKKQLITLSQQGLVGDDQVHPTSEAHKILYDFLKNINIL